MSVTRLTGDCREVMAGLPAGWFHSAITSPPYFNLRKYSDNDPREIGGEKSLDCMAWAGIRERCGECYLCHMTEVMGGRATNDGLWRVLRDDGVLWVNIGDSYANDTKWGGASGGKHVAALHGDTGIGRGKVATGLKAKDMCLVPQRLAFALQAAGWYVRSDIIWQKVNAMPSSVEDRCTSSHEHVWMLTKRPRYFFDNVAIMEPLACPDARRVPFGGVKHVAGQGNPADSGNIYNADTLGGRNKRDVWSICTKPDASAHFAIMPPALVEPCILSSTSARGCCPSCGAAWKRIVKVTVATSKPCPKTQAAHEARGGTADPVGTVGKSGGGRIDGFTETIGWEPSCLCPPAEPIPCRVLDPFAGAFTVGMVAAEHGRDFTGIELVPHNANVIAVNRLKRVQPRLMMEEAR